jgi:hypothetical protein
MFENSDAPTKTLHREAVPAPVHGDDGQRQAADQRHLAHHPRSPCTLIVANTVAMSARERVTEIAVMRTLGFGGGTSSASSSPSRS